MKQFAIMSICTIETAFILYNAGICLICNNGKYVIVEKEI